MLLLLIVILLLIGAFPRWPYSQGWGYGPSGLLAIVLIVIILMIVMDGLPLSGHYLVRHW